MGRDRVGVSRRILAAISTVLVVVLGVRAAAWIIEPVLAEVATLLLVALVVLVVVIGWRNRP